MFKQRPIIFYYPCGAGGKFLINSLGLSRHVVLHDIKLAIWDVQQLVHDQVYYDKKMQTILSTVPDRANDTQWQKYELGVNMFWDSPDSEHLRPIIEAKTKSFCLTAHTIDSLEKLRAKFPNSFVVKLSNYAKWMHQSQFKMPALQEDIQQKVAYWTYIDKKELQGINFYDALVDVDQNYTDLNKMTQCIKQLYQVLHLDDFQDSLWIQYHTRYLAAHKNID